MPLRVSTVFEQDCKILAMGSAFPEQPFTCTVHSIYNTALNLSIARVEPLITLIADEAYMHPLAALVTNVSREGRIHFDDLALFRGMKVRSDTGYMVFENGLKMCAISAKHTEIKDESPPAFPFPAAKLLSGSGITLDELQRTSATLLRHSFLYSPADPVDTAPDLSAAFRKCFVSAAHDTAYFLAAHDAPRAAQATLRLVGLGPGLTPSGDDFLCGFTLAAWIRTDPLWGKTGHLSAGVVQSWIDTVLDAADGEKPLTSDVSLAFLRLAKRRLFSHSLIALARSFIPGAHTDMFNDALADLGHLGHSSGLDSATGFLFGLDPATSRKKDGLDGNET